jgi:hypothetical protein
MHACHAYGSPEKEETTETLDEKEISDYLLPLSQIPS